MIRWNKLSNPILMSSIYSFKDQSVIYDKHEDTFYIFSSILSINRRKTNFSFVFSTDNFIDIKRFVFPYFGSSPDCKEINGIYYLVSQKEHHSLIWNLLGKIFRIREIVISSFTKISELTSANFYYGPKHFIPGRLIDGTIIYDSTSGYYYLAYRRWKKLYISRSKNWKKFPPGIKADIDVNFCENFQFVSIKNNIYLIATIRKEGIKLDNPYTSNHYPAIFYMVDNNWLTWRKLCDINIPIENWNIKMPCNTFSMLDYQIDGYYYGFFSGAYDTESFYRRGHCMIGICRNEDPLNNNSWEIPPRR